MFSQRISKTAFLPLLVVLLTVIASVAAHSDGASFRRHQRLHNRLNSVRELSETSNYNRAIAGTTRQRKSCAARTSASASSSSTSVAKSTSTSTKAAATKTTHAASSTAASNTANGSNLKPSNWPTATQAGAAPAATRTSAADPFLLQLSKAYNNADNALYTEVHTGQMTFYGQGLGACGDTYDDSSFTAAVSKLMYDAWPGATAGEMNRNPICGPFVPGRKALNQAGVFETVVAGAQFVDIGGDGLLNCDAASQCHIPLTATVKHGDNSIQVKIVDRCEACAIDDIDLTPTAFAALADMSLGRTSVEWFFNKY